MDHFEFSDVISLSKRTKGVILLNLNNFHHPKPAAARKGLAWLLTVHLVWFRRVTNVAVAPENWQGPKRKGSSSNHCFLEAMLVSGSDTNIPKQPL